MVLDRQQDRSKPAIEEGEGTKGRGMNQGEQGGLQSGRSQMDLSRPDPSFSLPSAEAPGVRLWILLGHPSGLWFGVEGPHHLSHRPGSPRSLCSRTTLTETSDSPSVDGPGRSLRLQPPGPSTVSLIGGL